MISKGHKKHTDLIRPAYGSFGRNEYAFLGAPCDVIKSLSSRIIAALSPECLCGYADAQHSDEITKVPGRLEHGAALEYTEHPGYQQVNYQGSLNPFQFRAQFSQCDMVLVNGNHHLAKKQVIIIDPAKKTSLQKRLSQLTDVKLFLLTDGIDEPFDFIKEAIPDWSQIPVYRLTDTGKIIDFFKSILKKAEPVINGLVLAGGKSIRMGYDKGAVNWHGREQRYHMADLLKNYCKEVFISCRDEQKETIDPAYQTLTDTFTGLGPFGAILSAFRQQPNRAWMVVACDLPLLDDITLSYLVSQRKISSVATTFQNPFDQFPEPLITIWEPKSYPVLLSFLAQGYSCPRKVLINSHTHVLQAPDPGALTNVNTPEELESVRQSLSKKTVNA